VQIPVDGGGEPALEIMRSPPVQRRFQQHEGADDIGLPEGSGVVGRPVHTALRRQMYHRVRLVFGERRAYRSCVADILLEQNMARAVPGGQCPRFWRYYARALPGSYKCGEVRIRDNRMTRRG
jgi:hypothetical protein